MKCAICGGTLRQARTTVSVETGTGVVVIRGVPARVCGQCGEDWLTDASAARVELIVARAKKGKSQLEVVALT